MVNLGKFGQRFPMKTYKNISGNADVKSYQLYLDAIKIRFADGSIYLFTHENSGEENVTRLKALAIEGKGLSTYIRDIGTASAQKLE